MLVYKTMAKVVQVLRDNRIKFWKDRFCYCSVHQHGNRDVTWKPRVVFFGGEGTARLLLRRIENELFKGFVFVSFAQKYWNQPYRAVSFINLFFFLFVASLRGWKQPAKCGKPGNEARQSESGMGKFQASPWSHTGWVWRLQGMSNGLFLCTRTCVPHWTVGRGWGRLLSQHWIILWYNQKSLESTAFLDLFFGLS